MKTLALSTTLQSPTRRTAPFSEEPGFYEPAKLWLYGNTRLLQSKLVMIEMAFGPELHDESLLHRIEGQAESAVLDGKTLVTGIHHLGHQRAAIVPLRWGGPRILVVHGGFYSHLGADLSEEPFKAARLWRYEFDAGSDLIVSRQSPDILASNRKYLPSVDALIRDIALKRIPGLLFE